MAVTTSQIMETYGINEGAKLAVEGLEEGDDKKYRRGLAMMAAGSAAMQARLLTRRRWWWPF
jgi:hypothetical protein